MRASERAYQRLRDDIISWRRLPGELLSENELAEELGVSRTPLRSALMRLALEDLVDTSRRTATVSRVSLKTIEDLFEVREALELQAVRLACLRRDTADFRDVYLALEDSERLVGQGDLDAYYAVIESFDAALDQAVDNPALVSALRTVRIHLARTRRMSAGNPERLRLAAQEHRRICGAIIDADAELATAAVMIHLRGSLQSLREMLAAQESSAMARAVLG